MNPLSVVTIEDLSNKQIEDILDLAKEISEDRAAFRDLADSRILASLFFEPSTRTRGSFESAMLRLGGDKITTTGLGTSAIEKGESLADTIRVWSGYADLIALRHPWEGAAQLAAEYSDVPVINAGDGGHEHPTQTLLDLFTIRARFGQIEGIKIALCGDLRNGRTIHSLTYALLRFGAEIWFVPGEGLDLPEHVKHKIETAYDRKFTKARSSALASLSGEETSEGAETPVDVVYMTPSKPNQPTLFEGFPLDDVGVVYVTRRQMEREPTGAKAKHYPRIDRDLLSQDAFKSAIVLHPLPRVDELASEFDSDTRAKYFEQAHSGVPVRMALIALLLGLKPWRKAASPTEDTRRSAFRTFTVSEHRCRNERCVTQRESQNTKPVFRMYNEQGLMGCNYCERETDDRFWALLDRDVYHPIGELMKTNADVSRAIFFSREEEAKQRGLRLSGHTVKISEPTLGTIKASNTVTR